MNWGEDTGLCKKTSVQWDKQFWVNIWYKIGQILEYKVAEFSGEYWLDVVGNIGPVWEKSELSTGRMDPRVGSGHDFAGFWRVGSGRVSTLDF